MTSHSIDVEIAIDDSFQADVCRETLVGAVVMAAQACGFSIGEIGLRICGDEEIRQLNREHLEHDYATDVISFGYTADQPSVEGELIVSFETAERTAASLTGWTTSNELVLYVVHGVLHICGMDDTDAKSRAEMRAIEREVLTRLGITDIARCGADEAETCENTLEAN